MGIRSNVQAGTFVTSPLGRSERPTNFVDMTRFKLTIRY